MDFVGYETCDKLIWSSGEGRKNTNKIRRKGIHNIYINKISPSSTLGFGYSPHKDTCGIFQNIWFNADLNHLHKKNRGLC